MSSERFRSQALLKKATSDAYRQSDEQALLVGGEVWKQTNREHRDEIKRLLAAPDLWESVAIVWRWHLSWLEMNPKRKLSSKNLSKLAKQLNVQAMIENGKKQSVPEPHGFADRAKEWWARIGDPKARTERAEAQMVDFLRDPSLLPKKPPRRQNDG